MRIQREYVDASSTDGVERLLDYHIPDDGEYTIFVRNTRNEATSYTLTVTSDAP